MVLLLLLLYYLTFTKGNTKQHLASHYQFIMLDENVNCLLFYYTM